jgi:hypothetical protein
MYFYMFCMFKMLGPAMLTKQLTLCAVQLLKYYKLYQLIFLIHILFLNNQGLSIRVMY